MLAATDRLDFVPPPAPGALRSLALAILAHAFLVAALTWGVHWRREAVTVTAEAELWSEIPQQAAPKLIEVPPEPAPLAEPSPPPVQAEPPLPSDADIALAQEKLRLKKEQQLEQERQRLAQLKQEKLLLEKQRLQEKREKEKQVAEEKKKADLEKRRKEALLARQEAQKLEAQRQANIKRMTGLADASGTATSTGTALQSSGPSASYAGKIVERIKSNTNFADSSAGKPTVVVLVRVAPGGTILSRKVVTPSSNKGWDEAVLRAIDKMDTLPRDVDGKIPEKVLSEGLELRVSL